MDTSHLRRLALGMVIAHWRERIYPLIQGKRLKQTDLAGKAKLAKGSVTRIENGKAAPDPEELRRIAAVFQTDPAELLREEELMFDLLLRALGPLRLAGEYEVTPPPASDITDSPVPVRLPVELRRRWERLIAAETHLSQERYPLEYETSVYAGQLAATRGRL